MSVGGRWAWLRRRRRRSDRSRSPGRFGFGFGQVVGRSPDEGGIQQGCAEGVASARGPPQHGRLIEVETGIGIEGEIEGRLNTGPSRHSVAPPVAAPSSACPACPHPRRPAPAGPRHAAPSRSRRHLRGPTDSLPSTAGATPPPHPSTRSSSTTSRPSSSTPLRPIPMAKPPRSGSRTTSAPTSAAASSPMASPASAVTRALPSASSPSPARAAASAPPATPAAWWRWRPTSPTTSCRHSPSAVAVGTPVARGPPHRTRRAELPHRAPTSGRGVKAVGRPGMLDAGLG
jgi:hypothetical protein